MAVSSFSVDSSNPLLAQPSTEAIIARSTSTSDTSQTLTVHGTTVTAGGYDSEAIALTGAFEIEFTNSGSDDWDSLTHAGLSATCAGTVNLYAQGTAGVGSIRFDSNPSNNDTLTIGLGATTQVYTFKTTLTPAANEVLIGGTAADTADNLKRAINDDGVAGTNYGTGTSANAFVSASVVTNVVTITDLLAIDRLSTWVLTESSTNFSLISPNSAVTGTLLASIAAGDTDAYDDIDLANEDLGDTNVPAGLDFQSDWILIAGGHPTLNLIATGTPALSVDYETSTDGSTARAGATSLTAIGSGTFYSVTLGEGSVQYIRLNIDNSGGTADRAVHAKVIY